MQRLFVYGTLAPGRSNHHVLADIPGSWQPATLKGFLKDEGWAAEMGYPGIVPSEHGDEVQGQAFSSEQLEQHWPRIDDFEGDGYQRIVVQIKVETEDGEHSETEAFVYALRDE